MWNYRIIKDTDNNNESYYRVVEVYYNKNLKPTAWADCTDSILTCDNKEDLIETIKYLQHIIGKPILERLKNDGLREIKE